jgi:hypothetical protein
MLKGEATFQLNLALTSSSLSKMLKGEATFQLNLALTSSS